MANDTVAEQLTDCLYHVCEVIVRIEATAFIFLKQKRSFRAAHLATVCRLS